ncbi:MAG: S8 family serine peptidase [Ignavibacteriaceae bacterium]|nr:S8 family serine peptidase [Ignavibacteriaceae bacterium]
MKKIILLFLFIIPFSYSQNKYYIYFKDKEINSGTSLNKNSALYTQTVNLLTERCIARRQKSMGKDNIVTFEDISLSKTYVNKLQTIGIKIENQLKWFNAVSAYLTDEQKAEVQDLSFVKSIEAVRVKKFTHEKTSSNAVMHKIGSGPTKAEYGFSYFQLNLSDIPAVHSKGITGDGIIIGILDNGFHWKEHESLINKKVIGEYNFVFHDSSTAYQTGDAAESGNHGTMVFSIIGGFKDNFMIGAAYNASFILAKTEDDRSESRIEEDNYAAALEWMEGLGADVTTSSLGYTTFDDTTYSYTYKDLDGKTTISAKAVELAFQRGVLTFSAAGNEGADTWYYIDTPADAADVIAVGAVNSDNNIAEFSSHGPTYDGRIKPEVVAMGVTDYGADVSASGGYSSYEYGSGTSYATPIASGVGALLLSAFPYLTNVQARNIILATADNTNSPNNTKGYGLISAEKAIAYPNLSDTSGSYRINKIFFSTNAIANAYIHYSTDSALFNTQSLSYDGSLKYSYAVPQYSNGQRIYFYFTYTDSAGSDFREPSTGSYALKYGQMEIVTSVINSSATKGSVLSTNYPNPFNPFDPLHPYTKIDFYPNSNENAKLIILDAIGQTVKVLFNGMAMMNPTSVTWDGRNDRGIMCASGVYYYILTIGGKSYGNKMVLVK